MKLLRVLSVGLMLSTMGLVTGCGDDDNNVPVTVVEPAQLLQITPDPANINIGQQLQFTATATSANAQQNVTNAVTWISDNPAVLTINGTGLATGVSAGVVTVRAVGQFTNDTATVTVGTPANFSLALANGGGTNADLTQFASSTNRSSGSGGFQLNGAAESFFSTLTVQPAVQGGQVRTAQLSLVDTNAIAVGDIFQFTNNNAITPRATLVFTQAATANTPVRRFVATGGTATVVSRAGNLIGLNLAGVTLIPDATQAGNTAAGQLNLSGPLSISF
jgi:trimeric autotransporter adhesin